MRAKSVSSPLLGRDRCIRRPAALSPIRRLRETASTQRRTRLSCRRPAAPQIRRGNYRGLCKKAERWPWEMDVMRGLARGYVLSLAVAAFSAAASAENPPSSTELLAWVACLKSNGVDPVSGNRSREGLETAFIKCSRQEGSLRQAISRDPSRFPEYNLDSMKSVLRAQQDEPKK